MKQIISKAFFGKSNCLKLSLNDEGEFYFQFGIPENGDAKNSEKWLWKKVKMNDDELGSMLNVLEGKKDSVSFVHDFKGEKTSIFMNRKDNFLFIKVKDISKSLNEGEQIVLRELLKYAILRMNMFL
jgi:hypothetical protein